MEDFVPVQAVLSLFRCEEKGERCSFSCLWLIRGRAGERLFRGLGLGKGGWQRRNREQLKRTVGGAPVGDAGDRRLV